MFLAQWVLGGRTKPQRIHLSARWALSAVTLFPLLPFPACSPSKSYTGHSTVQEAQESEGVFFTASKK